MISGNLTIATVTAIIPRCPRCEKESYLVETQRRNSRTHLHAVKCASCGEDILAAFQNRKDR